MVYHWNSVIHSYSMFVGSSVPLTYFFIPTTKVTDNIRTGIPLE